MLGQNSLCLKYNTIQYKKHLDAPFPKGSERLHRKTLILQDKITIVIKCISLKLQKKKKTKQN